MRGEHEFAIMFHATLIDDGRSSIVCRHEGCPARGDAILAGGPHTLSQIHRALWHHIAENEQTRGVVVLPLDPPEVREMKLSRRFSTAALIVAIVTGAFGVTGFMFSITALFGGH